MSIQAFKKTIACFLVLLLLLPLLPTTAHAVSQADIDAARAERDALTQQREEKQAVVDGLKEEQAGILEQKQALDDRNGVILLEIESIDKEIDLYDQMIEQKAREVNMAQITENAQLERYRARVRSMEEDGNTGLVAIILNARSLGDLLTLLDDASDVMKSDVALYEDYIEAREATEAAKAEYEATRTELDSRKLELRGEQEELQAEMAEATDLIAKLQENIEENQAQYEELLAAENQANQELAELIARREREREAALAAQAADAARRAAQSGNNGGNNNGGSSGGETGGEAAPPPPPVVTGTGSFAWPVPSCTYITSRFGYRVHPIFGTVRNHTGIDIGASYGASINASDGGTVTLAQYYGGYGNCVMIDHGNGRVTLYGHMSSLGVSVGQAVSQGQYIGAVGDTGWATGPHCHFEIYINGGRVDPEMYFSGLTISPDAGV